MPSNTATQRKARCRTPIYDRFGMQEAQLDKVFAITLAFLLLPHEQATLIVERKFCRYSAYVVPDGRLATYQGGAQPSDRQARRR